MTLEQQQQFVADLKKYVTENLPLSQLSDEELQKSVEDIVTDRLSGS